ncbi:RHS repeat-associated core domain-containing protein [Pseudomonas hunanensis]|uniref:RHS repeat-associated core domain-containing protein n=1 Tax=Pseudomonas hunanensis TaxID=1247546 RepID=UPI0030DC8D01
MSLASRSQVKITALVYSPYGHIGSQAGRATIIGFKDERFDPLLGTYALGRGYRSYSPALMRFLKPDDLSPFSDGGYNAYAYCACDPINYRDYTGQQREFANLQKFWEQKSNPKPQRTAPLTKMPAAQAIEPPLLNARHSASHHLAKKKTVAFNKDITIKTYPKEQVTYKSRLLEERRSLAIYIKNLTKRAAQKQREYTELSEPSSKAFAKSQGISDQRYRTEMESREVWLTEAQYRIRALEVTLKSFDV